MGRMEKIWQNLWKRKKKKFSSAESDAKDEENKENDATVADRGKEEEVERITIKSSGTTFLSQVEGGCYVDV